MAGSIPTWQEPRLDYSPNTTAPLTKLDFERIEANTLNLRNQAAPGATTTGSNNTYAVVVQSIPGLENRVSILVKFHETNTGPATLNLNNLGARPILNYRGEQLKEYEIATNQFVLLVYNGTAWQSFSITKEYNIVKYGLYGAATGTGNNYTVTILELRETPPTGTWLLIKFPEANTGPVTLNINSYGAWPIKKEATLDLIAGEIQAGEIVPLVWDGTNLQALATSALVRAYCSRFLEDFEVKVDYSEALIIDMAGV